MCPKNYLQQHPGLPGHEPLPQAERTGANRSPNSFTAQAFPRNVLERLPPLALTEKWEVKNEDSLPFIFHLPSFCQQPHPGQHRVIQNECVNPTRAVPLCPKISTEHSTPFRCCG